MILYQLVLHVQGYKASKLVNEAAQFMLDIVLLLIKGNALRNIDRNMYYVRESAPSWCASFNNDNSGTFELRYKDGSPCVRTCVTKDGYAVPTFFESGGRVHDLGMVRLVVNTIARDAWQALDEQTRENAAIASLRVFKSRDDKSVLHKYKSFH